MILVNRLSDEELLTIHNRCAKATPGPWFTKLPPRKKRSCVLATLCDTEVLSSSRCKEDDTADAEFIAHARTDVPALLEEIFLLKEDLHDLLYPTG